jgi:DMSO/TMAO reductase YedYZ molybdopterin-dependent catalytic subunit
MNVLLLGCVALSFTLPRQPTSCTAMSHRLAQTKADVLLTISGEVERPQKLTGSDIAALPRLTVRAKNHSGEEAAFEGVALLEILKKAGMKFGESTRGKALSTYFVIKASDGYQAIFTPPEVDPAFTDRVVLLADKKNGSPLSAAEGPLSIVVPDEKREARWVSNVISISVRHAE